MKKILSGAVLAICFATSSFAATVTGGSGILTASSADQLETWLGEGPIGLTAIFSKAPGLTASDFHSAADGKGRTFSVIELSNGNVIGGYNPQSWNSSNSYNREYTSTAFLFNLTTGRRYDHNGLRGYETYNGTTFGPTFGGGYDLLVDNTLSTGYANLGYDYGSQYRFGTIAYRTEFAGPKLFYTITKLDVFTVGAVAPVPLPAGGLLLLTGLVGVAGLRCRQKRAA